MVAVSPAVDPRVKAAWDLYRVQCRQARLSAATDVEAVEAWAWDCLQRELARLKRD